MRLLCGVVWWWCGGMGLVWCGVVCGQNLADTTYYGPALLTMARLLTIGTLLTMSSRWSTTPHCLLWLYYSLWLYLADEARHGAGQLGLGHEGLD